MTDADCGKHLDEIARLMPMCRESYGTDPDQKPNDHCNWERLLPTTTSPMGWVENDEHFRDRVKQGGGRPMKTVKVSELEGAALDWAVANAVGYTVTREADGSYMVEDGTICLGRTGKDYSPSTDWSQGGPLIEGYSLHLYKSGPSILPKAEPAYWASGAGEEMHIGPTPLIAACRAIVAAKYGDTVEVPEELM